MVDIPHDDACDYACACASVVVVMVMYGKPLRCMHVIMQVHVDVHVTSLHIANPFMYGFVSTVVSLYVRMLMDFIANYH